MSGTQVMVILIVAMALIASVMKARYGHFRRHGGAAPEGEGRRASAENDRLRDEVKALKERLAVLERITIEKENSLEREIERLRDR